MKFVLFLLASILFDASNRSFAQTPGNSISGQVPTNTASLAMAGVGLALTTIGLIRRR